MTTQPWSVYERRLTDRETLKVAIELADQYGDNLQDLKPLLLKEGGATVMEVVNFLAPDTVYSFDARGELIAFLVDAAGWNHHPPPPDGDVAEQARRDDRLTRNAGGRDDRPPRREMTR